MISLCIDAGTSLVKCVAFDAEGGERALAARKVAVDHPTPEASEQDMDAVWAATAAAVREVVDGLDEPVALLSVTAQGDGLWLVDDDDRPAGPAVLWNDARATWVVDGWDEAGLLEAGFRRSGSVMNAGLPHAVLAHLRDRDPERLERADCALTCGGWLHLRLTGRRAVDVSEASNPWMAAADPATTGTAYADDLLAQLDLEWARDLLPGLRDGAERAAPLADRAARELGLPAGLDVVMAPYDVVATALGVGAAADGMASCILGTTLCTQVATTRPDLDGAPAGMTLRTGTPGLVLRSLATLAGTEVIDWAVDLLGLPEPAELSRLAAAAPAGPGPVLLPYLSPAGERMPFRDPAASGAVFGLRLGQGREALARAVLDGLSCVVRDCLEAAGGAPAELRVCGGGAASDEWCSRIADVAGVDVVRTQDRQCGAKGAQVAALVALGRADSADAAVAELVRPGRRFAPAPERRASAQEAYATFVALRDDARATQWPRLRVSSGAATPAIPST